MLHHIYKIIVGNKLYIGSTTNPKKRWRKHKNNAKETSRDAHLPLYITMRLIGVDNCVFEVLYEIECVDKTEARKVEQAEINKYKKEILLNMYYAYRTQKEYQKTDQHKEYQKEYAKTNKYKEYQIEYHKEYRKEYAKTYKPKEYQKEYVNRPEVKERRNRQARERRAKKKLELKPVSVAPNDTSANIISSPNDTQ